MQVLVLLGFVALLSSGQDSNEPFDAEPIQGSSVEPVERLLQQFVAEPDIGSVVVQVEGLVATAEPEPGSIAGG